jgi:hypothetical protein
MIHPLPKYGMNDILNVMVYCMRHQDDEFLLRTVNAIRVYVVVVVVGGCGSGSWCACFGGCT